MKRLYAIVLAVEFLTMGALEVNGTEPENELIKPKFLYYPSGSYIVDAYGVVQFSFEFIGSPAPQVEIYKDNVKITFPNNWSRLYITYNIKNKTGTAEFIINEAYPEDSGDYTCKLKNKAGETQRTATLIVKEKDNEIFYYR